jgi:hypothetical protein
MTAGSNDNIPYTAQDIERYHAGQMSAQEMHALEKAALDDAFLADALEGYQFTKTPTEDVAALKELLAQKTEEEKVVPLAAPRKRSYPLLRIAALVLLLLGAGWSVYYLMDNKKDTLALEIKPAKKAVLQKAPAPPADSAAVANAPLQTETTTLKMPPTVTLPTERLSKPQEVAPEAPADATTAPSVASVAVADSQRPMLLKDEPSKNEAVALRKQAMPSNALEGRVAGVDLQQVPVNNVIQGRVVDQNNRAVPHASVAIRGTNTGTTTDDKGNFSLKATDTSVNATVAAVGYETKNVTLNNQRPETNIVLNESNQALEEVVVVGYGGKRKKSAAATSALPAPTKGWQHFEEYVTQNRLSGKELDTESPNGSVTLSFDVNRKGEPTNIKVENPLSPSLDAEAIRLLQKGPKWERKKNSRGKVTIHFP